MSRAANFWPAVVGGLLLGLSFPPFNLRFLVFIALALWLKSLPTLSPKSSFLSGYCLGFVFFLGQLHWVDVLATRWTHSFGLGFTPYLICCFLGSFYGGLLGWLLGACLRSGRDWMTPFVWAGVEVFRSYIFLLAFPYSLLGNPLWPYPALIQSARYGSIFLVGAWIFLVNLSVARLLNKQGVQRWQLAGIACVLLLGLGQYAFKGSVENQGTSVNVAAGQTGIDMAFDDLADKKVPGAVAELTAEADRGHVQLLILPEGLPSTVQFPYTPMPILAGEQRLSGNEKGDIYQSALLFQDGEMKGYADKTRLVVFGEYVPGRAWLPFLSSFHLPSGDMVPADKVTSIDTKIGRVGPVLCFEALFPDIAFHQATNGSKLLAVMSIDDWYTGTGAPEQLKGASVFRSIETGLPVVRAASLGYTFVVDQKGVIIAEAPLAQRRVLQATVSIPDRPTPPYWLPIFPLASVLVLAGLVVESLVRRKPKPIANE